MSGYLVDVADGFGANEDEGHDDERPRTTVDRLIRSAYTGRVRIGHSAVDMTVAAAKVNVADPNMNLADAKMPVADAKVPVHTPMRAEISAGADTRRWIVTTRNGKHQ